MEWIERRRARLPETAVLLTIIGIVAVFGSVATTAKAQVGGLQGTPPGLISLDVVDADLSQVVRILMGESKQNIVIADPDIKDKKVTAMLNSMPLETALKYVVESVGCVWHREPDGVYIVGGKSYTQPSSPVSAMAGTEASVPLSEGISAARDRAVGFADYRARRETKVEVIRLYNASPVDIMWTLGLYAMEEAPRVERAVVKPPVYMQKSDGSLEPLPIFSQSTPPLTESLRNNPAYAQRAPGFGDEAAQAYPPAPPGYTRPRPTQAPPTTARPGVAPGAAPGTQQAAGLLPEGIEFIQPYDLDNSLIVRGDEEGIEELKTIISKLDIAPKQIMIEAKFVSIATSELESLGINWSLERLNTTFSTQFTPAGNVVVGYASGDLMANLRTQMSKSHGKLINAPIITTMNNVPASIGFQTTVPYLSSTMVFNQAGTPTSSTATFFLPITSQLWVLPRINNADNSITVNVMPRISDIEKYVSTQLGDVPIVNSQFVQTIRRVGNGETIVLGGLIRKEDSTSVDKIPFLGDLPIIGRLFRSTKTTIDDKELLIFLTPTIVPEKPIAGAGIGVIP